MNTLSIVIPCFNEEKGIGKVIRSIPKSELEAMGFEVEILVIDNNSRDRTSQVARRAGARVLHEGRQGKTYALYRGFTAARGDILVTIDGDNTYRPQDIPQLVANIDDYDLVIGTRFDSLWTLSTLREPRDQPFKRTLANKVGAVMGTVIMRKKVTDVTTGLRAFRKEMFEKIPPIKAIGLDFEAELTARIIANGCRYGEVKITTNAREGQSSLQYFRDAFRFLWAMIRGTYERKGKAHAWQTIVASTKTRAAFRAK